MSKIAFIYPGQGAQTIGMGKDFYQNSPGAKAVFEESSRLLGFNIADICFEENDLLDRTDYTQAALVTTCLAMTREIMDRGLMPDMTAGLSLGEYCAISAAGGMSLADAVTTIWTRGRLMHSAVPGGLGGMAAVLGLPGEQVRQITDGIEGVWVANYNCPGQVAITGNNQGLEQAAAALKEAGARRIIPLKVSGPFHSPYMETAGSGLRDRLDQVKWQPLKIPYVANVNAEVITDIARTKDLLQQQVSSSVLWEQSVKTMTENGIDVFLEIGPGMTLSKLIKKTDRTARICHISNMEELNCVLEELKDGH